MLLKVILMTQENQLRFKYKDLLEEGAIHDPKVDQKQIEYDLNLSQKSIKKVALIKIQQKEGGLVQNQ